MDNNTNIKLIKNLNKEKIIIKNVERIKHLNKEKIIKKSVERDKYLNNLRYKFINGILVIDVN